jgi:hypothetical protein
MLNPRKVEEDERNQPGNYLKFGFNQNCPLLSFFSFSVHLCVCVCICECVCVCVCMCVVGMWVGVLCVGGWVCCVCVCVCGCGCVCCVCGGRVCMFVYVCFSVHFQSVHVLI